MYLCFVIRPTIGCTYMTSSTEKKNVIPENLQIKSISVMHDC